MSRRLIALAAVTAAMFSFLAFAGAAGAHLTQNGVWTYRYYDRNTGDGAWGHCNNGTGSVDPMNLIVYQYGEYGRADAHIENETDVGYYDGHSPHFMCGTDNAGASYFTHGEFNEQQGHGCLSHCSGRAHMRLWFAPHGHGPLVDKWTALGVHHETVVCCFSHEIDEDWEVWEGHIASEMDGHNIYWDEYFRGSYGLYRGWFDNGYATRIGGLHNGGY